VPVLVVVEERDDTRLAGFHVGDVGGQPEAEELLDPIRHGAVRVTADFCARCVRCGGMEGVLAHGERIA
jgi:hypothetical protein